MANVLQKLFQNEKKENNQVLELSDNSWVTSLNDWIHWLNDQLESWMEFFFPMHWRNLNPLDEADRLALEEQEKRKNLLQDYNRKRVLRQSILRKNFADDMARVQQKGKICKNWHDQERDNLILKRDHALGQSPPIGSDLSKVPGWRVERGDSEYNGHIDLCEKLQCSDLNQILLQKDSNSYYWELQSLLEEKDILSKQNKQLQNKLNSCHEKIGDSDNYLPVSNPKQIFISSSQHQDQTPTFESPLNNPPRMIPFNENILEQIIYILILPITITDAKASIWNGRAPFWPFRLCMSGVLVIFWFQIMMVLFRLINYGLDFLPEPSEKKKVDSNKNKSKKKKNSNFNSVTSDWFQNIAYKIRGGTLIYNKSFIDPIFILIHLEKIRRRSNLDLKILQQLQSAIFGLFLSYGTLIILTFPKNYRFETENFYNTLMQKIELDCSFKKIYRISEIKKTGTFFTSFPLEKKMKRQIKTKEKRTKIVRFSDLPPLTNLDLNKCNSNNYHEVNFSQFENKFIKIRVF